MNENKKINCTCKCNLTPVMKKINEFRNSNRLMIQKQGYVGLSFFKRDDPDNKFFKLNMEPDVKCSVVDIVFAAAGVFAVIAVVKAVTGIVRFIKYQLW